MNYYVYYKLSPESVADMRAKVRALFALVEEQFGIRGRWMRRRDDPATYMEVYEGIEDERAFDALLERVGATMKTSRRVDSFRRKHLPERAHRHAFVDAGPVERVSRDERLGFLPRGAVDDEQSSGANQCVHGMVESYG